MRALSVIHLRRLLRKRIERHTRYVRQRLQQIRAPCLYLFCLVLYAVSNCRRLRRHLVGGLEFLFQILPRSTPLVSCSVQGQHYDNGLLEQRSISHLQTQSPKRKVVCGSLLEEEHDASCLVSSLSKLRLNVGPLLYEAPAPLLDTQT